VLDPVLVPGDQAAADLAVVRVLALLIEERRVAVQPLDHARADGRLFAEPDRRTEHEDVGSLHALVEGGPVVALGTVLAHVGPYTRCELVVDGPDLVDRDAVRLHDRLREVDQPLRVRPLRRALERAVDVQRAQFREVPTIGRA